MNFIKVFTFKLNKIVLILGVVLIIAAFLFVGNLYIFANNGDGLLGDPVIEDQKQNDEAIKEPGKSEEINGEHVEDLDKTRDDAMEIFPRDDYEDWKIDGEKEFFVEYKLQRDRIRAKAIEELNQLMDKPDVSQDVREKAENELLELIDVMEKEMVIENLIKAHGFDDAIFFHSRDNATVVIKADSLSETEVYQITEIVSDKLGINMNDVKVIEKGN